MMSSKKTYNKTKGEKLMTKKIFEAQIAKRKRGCHSCGGKIIKGELSLAITIRERRVNLCKECLAIYNHINSI
jgi:hypothetical protein